MNYKILSGIFASLFAISCWANVYHYCSKTSTPIVPRRVYEKRVLESELMELKNRQNLRRLQERVEDLERKYSSNYYFPWTNEYDSRRVL